MATVRLRPYAERLRLHLADSRRAGYPWEQAWRRALRDLTPESDFPLCTGEPDCKRSGHACGFIRGQYRDGYMRIGSTRVARVSAIVENDRWTDTPAYHAPPAGLFRCGWGDGCDVRLSKRGLCAEHAAIIEAIPQRCMFVGCKNDAPTARYCWRHEGTAESNARGSLTRAA